MQLFKKFAVLGLTICIPLISTADQDMELVNDGHFKTSVYDPQSDKTSNRQVVRPGALRTISVSNTDTNLVVCENGALSDHTNSQEKPMEFSYGKDTGNSTGFIKFLKLNDPQAGTNSLYTKETELYLTCNGEIFSLLLVPTEIHTQAILLVGSRAKSINDNISLFSELDIEDAAVTLIDKVQFSELLPESFTVSNSSHDVAWQAFVPTMKSRLIRSVKPDGVGLALHEYVIYSDHARSLNEFDFVKLKPNSFAVRLSETNVQERGSVKAYIVERLW